MNKPNSQAQRAPEVNSGSFLSKLSTEDKIAYACLFIILIMVYMIRSKFLSIPFERDEGAYSYYGKMLLDGGVPYKDFYEQKFPGIFYFFAFIVLIFGDTVKELHFGFLCLNLATIAFVFFAVKKLFSPIAAVMAAATYALVSLTPNISGFTIQSEHGVAFFSSMGIYFYAIASKRKKWYHFLFMGAAMGAAFMTKTTGVFIGLWGGLILISDFFFTKEKVYKNLFKEIAFYAIGGLSVIAILFLLVFLKGSFNEMLFWTFDMPKYYVNRVPLEEGMKYFDYTKEAVLKFNKFFWLHGLLAIILIVIKGIDWKTKFFTISLAAFSFMTIVPGYYFYGHYWLQMIPGLAILSGVTCYAILFLFKSKFNIQSSYIAYGYLGIFAIIIYAHLNKYKNYYFKPNYEQILRTTYGNNPFPEAMEISKWINENTKPEDEMVVIGSEPQMYIYTNKKSPTNHIFFSTIVADIPQHKQWQREYSASIEKHKPKYLVYFNVPISLLVQPNTDKYVFDWLSKYINDNYKIVGFCDMIEGQTATYVWKEQLQTYKPSGSSNIQVYELKDAATPTPPVTPNPGS